MKDRRKVHLKLKNKSLCGVKGKKLRYVDDEEEVSCARCKKAIEK